MSAEIAKTRDPWAYAQYEITRDLSTWLAGVTVREAPQFAAEMLAGGIDPVRLPQCVVIVDGSSAEDNTLTPSLYSQPLAALRASVMVSVESEIDQLGHQPHLSLCGRVFDFLWLPSAELGAAGEWLSLISERSEFSRSEYVNSESGNLVTEFSISGILQFAAFLGRRSGAKFNYE